jgi:chorismate mutase
MSDDQIESLRAQIDTINDRLLHVIAERQEVSLAIGALKAARGLPLYSHEREAKLLARFRADALEHGLDPDYVEELMNVVLRHSRAAQRKQVDADDSGTPSP